MASALAALAAFTAFATLTACAPSPADTVTVTKIVDGDTIVVERNHEETKVRLLAIDTPEKGECLYDEATDRLTELIPPGTRVRLEYDTERQDRYGRDLAAVFDGDTFVNEQLLLDGYARPLTVQPNTKYQKRAEAAAARALDKGINVVGVECLLPGDVAKQALERYERDPDPFYKAVMREAVDNAQNFTYRERAFEYIDSL